MPKQWDLLKDQKGHSVYQLESKFEVGKTRDKNTCQQSIVKLEKRDGMVWTTEVEKRNVLVCKMFRL